MSSIQRSFHNGVPFLFGIHRQNLALRITFPPTPRDCGQKSISGSIDGRRSKSFVYLVCCFLAGRSCAGAFDLYFIIWTELKYKSWEHRVTAALDCARSSATSPQDSCVETILYNLLSFLPSRGS